ncbi:MAG: GlcG/HbpS family heme-binding protein [Thiohalospira sp.]|uniref:GlcG/HbpS family heme-binding protein n=1 Tax=Thiohalospira sp. TaxID=3080549 RepID=UPI00397F2730
MSIKQTASVTALVAALGLVAGPAAAEDASVSTKRMTMETANKAAVAAVEACREEGVQVTATVVDRWGDPQAVVRDTLAMDLTLAISEKKAYTAVQFNSATSEMEGNFEGNYSVPKYDKLVIAAGGVPIEAGGDMYGGIGISGAPSGELDEECAAAGADAVSEDLEFGDM